MTKSIKESSLIQPQDVIINSRMKIYKKKYLN